MSDSFDPALKAAVLEWQQKYGVKDGDPLLACLELFQIYLTRWQGRNENGSSSYDEFRSSFEALERRTRALSTLASELTDALRGVPNLKGEFQRYRATALGTVALFAFMAGAAIGKLLL